MDSGKENAVRRTIADVLRSKGRDAAAALRLAREVEALLDGLKTQEPGRSSDSGYLTDEALVLAAEALWFGDRSKHTGALWSIAKRLSPDIKAAVDATPLSHLACLPEPPSIRIFLDQALLAVLRTKSEIFREVEIEPVEGSGLPMGPRKD